MSGPLQRFIASIGPSWIHERNIGAFLEAVGRTLDDAVQACMEGILASNPLYCEADALSLIARDRLIRLYPTEPEESQRYRLSIWHQLRGSYGTARGILLSLQPYFRPLFPMIRVVHQSGSDPTIATWWTIDAAGEVTAHAHTPSNWQWDTHPLSYGRYWVVIYVDASMGPASTTWDGGEEWDGGAVWDGYLGAAQIRDIVALIKESTAPHAKLAGVILATDPASHDPTETVHYVSGLSGPTTQPDGLWNLTVDPATNLPTRLQTDIFAFEDAAP